MPLEVVVEVFRSLDPLDILRLSRTSKDLRRVLLSSSSRSVWQDALRNAGCPPTPDDMSEPRFAALLFDSICHFCHRAPCPCIYWDIKMRLHDQCVPRALYTFDELTQLKNWSKDVQAMMDRLCVLGPDRVNCIPFYHDTRYRKLLKGVSRNQSAYLPSTIKQLRLEYIELKDDPTSLAKWEESKLASYHKRVESNEVCKEWYRNHQRAEIRRNRELIQERRQAIKVKLTPLGWTDNEFADGAFGTHSLVIKTQSLSEEEWTLIEPAFPPLLDEIKASQFKARQTGVYRQRFSALINAYQDHSSRIMRATNRRIIACSEFLVSNEAKPVVDLIFDTSTEEKLLFSDMQELLPIGDQLSALSEQQFSQRETELRASLAKRTRRPIEQVIFKCKECNTILWAPHVFHHLCPYNHRTRTNAQQIDWKWPQYNPFTSSHIQVAPLYAVGRFEYDSSRTALAKQMLDLCGVADLQNLAKLNPLFECLSCSKGVTRVFFRWNTAILNHCSQKKHKIHTLSVSSYNDATLRQVRTREYAGAIRLGIPMSEVVCKVCPSGSVTASKPNEETLDEHMKFTHPELEEILMEVHWTWNASADYFRRQRYPSFTRIVNGVVIG
ncbi:hypothetical protein PQX77_017741 [Marasmius sp. AFHP31]|nr:hypothetical protein PQX77_017741 [Marasmius sp. AFHP31]